MAKINNSRSSIHNFRGTLTLINKNNRLFCRAPVAIWCLLTTVQVAFKERPKARGAGRREEKLMNRHRELGAGSGWKGRGRRKCQTLIDSIPLLGWWPPTLPSSPLHCEAQAVVFDLSLPSWSCLSHWCLWRSKGLGKDEQSCYQTAEFFLEEALSWMASFLLL